MRSTIWYPITYGAILLGFMLVLSGCLPGWNAKPVAESLDQQIVEVDPLKPPLWIQGNWIAASDGDYEVEFSANNVIVTAMGSDTNYGLLYQNSPVDVANQESTESLFAFVVQPQEGLSGVTVMFQRVDDNTLRHTIQLNPEMSIGPITLYRPGTEPSIEPEPPADEPPPSDDPPPPPSDDPPPPPPVEPPPPNEPPDPPQSQPEQIESALNPPDWIQGEWNSAVEGEYDVEFTDNSVIVTALDFPINYGELYRNSNANVIEEITDEIYQFEVMAEDGTLEERFIFVRLTDLSILHSIEKEGGVTIGPVTLFRPGQEELPPVEPPAEDPPPVEDPPPADEPPADDPPADPPADEPAGCEDWQVDINSADAEDLRRIIHVGDGLITPDAVIAARPFATVDDLTNVSQLSEAHLSDIKDQDVACVA